MKLKTRIATPKLTKTWMESMNSFRVLNKLS